MLHSHSLNMRLAVKCIQEKIIILKVFLGKTFTLGMFQKT